MVDRKVTDSGFGKQRVVSTPELKLNSSTCIYNSWGPPSQLLLYIYLVHVKLYLSDQLELFSLHNVFPPMLSLTILHNHVCVFTDVAGHFCPLVEKGGNSHVSKL